MVKAWPGGPLWFCACAEINRDGNLRPQYLAGLALNTSTETVIYCRILQYRRVPASLLKGSEPRMQALYSALAGASK